LDGRPSIRTAKPSRYVTSHSGQLSLAIPLWVGAMRTSESWGVNRHTERYTSPRIRGLAVYAGAWLRAKETQISAAPYGPCGSRRTLLLRILHQGPTVPDTRAACALLPGMLTRPQGTRPRAKARHSKTKVLGGKAKAAGCSLQDQALGLQGQGHKFWP